MSKGRWKWALVVVAGLAFLIGGRLYRRHLREQWLKPVAIVRRDTKIDITLPVISKSCDPHGGCIVEADGLYQGRPTGVTVIFAPGMRASTFTGRMETTQVFPKIDGITLVAEGPRGTSLVEALAAAYGAPPHHVNLPVTIRLTAIPFEGDPSNIQTRPLQFKIVHPGSKDSPNYFELFINTDLANNQVQISEKAITYRKAVLRAMGTQ